MAKQTPQRKGPYTGPYKPTPPDAPMTIDPGPPELVIPPANGTQVPEPKPTASPDGAARSLSGPAATRSGPAERQAQAPASTAPTPEGPPPPSAPDDGPELEIGPPLSGRQTRAQTETAELQHQARLANMQAEHHRRQRADIEGRMGVMAQAGQHAADPQQTPAVTGRQVEGLGLTAEDFERATGSRPDYSNYLPPEQQQQLAAFNQPAPLNGRPIMDGLPTLPPVNPMTTAQAAVNLQEDNPDASVTLSPDGITGLELDYVGGEAAQQREAHEHQQRVQRARRDLEEAREMDMSVTELRRRRRAQQQQASPAAAAGAAGQADHPQLPERAQRAIQTATERAAEFETNPRADADELFESRQSITRTMRQHRVGPFAAQETPADRDLVEQRLLSAMARMPKYYPDDKQLAYTTMLSYAPLQDVAYLLNNPTAETVREFDQQYARTLEVDLGWKPDKAGEQAYGFGLSLLAAFGQGLDEDGAYLPLSP